MNNDIAGTREGIWDLKQVDENIKTLGPRLFPEEDMNLHAVSSS